MADYVRDLRALVGQQHRAERAWQQPGEIQDADSRKIHFTLSLY